MPMIRRATSADLDGLLSLRLALMRETGKVHGAADEQTLYELTRAYLHATIPQGRCLVWVGEEEGQLVATGGLVFLEGPPSHENPSGLEGYIFNMYTHPAWRGRGLAHAILRQIIIYAREETPARRLWLRATAAGRPLYEGEGFSVARRDMELVW
jgi:GNAT superfamily N-acetyltransferase